MHPSSRGSVHIQSGDCVTPPRVDLSFLTNPSDLEMMKLGVKYILRLAETESWKNASQKCLLYDDLDKEAEDPIGEYCRERGGTTFHWLGTAAMLPREKGGVVDSRLKVYGVSNLRVVRSYRSLSS